MTEKCKHHFDLDAACPWCGREAKNKEAHFAIPKKSFQLYQDMFNGFLTSIADRAHGPLAVSIVATDMNGNIYTYIEGQMISLEEHVVRLSARLEEDKKKLKDKFVKGKKS